MELNTTQSGVGTVADRARWSSAFTMAGWCALIAYLGLIAIEVRRAAAITTASFEDGIWGQRVETISFVTIPQNIIVLVIAAICVAVAAIISSTIHPDDQPPQSARTLLARVIGGLSVISIGLALLGLGGIPFRYVDPLADLGALVGRAAGVALAAASSRLAREALGGRDATQTEMIDSESPTD